MYTGGEDMSEFSEKIKTYVKENLCQPITLNDISGNVGYSKYYVSRRFTEDEGISVFEYIRRERLTAAAMVLRTDNDRVLDVALDFMFDSHEGFTRAFVNGFGITPSRFASYSAKGGWLIPYNYLNRHQKKMEEKPMKENATVIFTQIMQRPARKMILFRAKKATDYFSYCEEVGCGSSSNSAPWDILSEIKEALNEPMGIWLPSEMVAEGTGVYAHAVEVPADYSGDIPAGFDIIDLAPCQYIIFQGQPYDDDDFEAALGEVWNNIETFNPRVYGYEWDEAAAPRFQLAPMGWRGYIEGRPVRKITV